MNKFFFRNATSLLRPLFAACLLAGAAFSVSADSDSSVDGTSPDDSRLVPIAEDPDGIPPAVHSHHSSSVTCDRCRGDGETSSFAFQQQSISRVESTGNGGVSLHNYGGNFRSRGSFGGNGNSDARRHSGYGHTGGRAVELETGIPGMRVSEWPSASTGLTLSEEQQLQNSGSPSHGSFCTACGNSAVLPRVIAPVSQTGYSVPIRKPYLNIPEYVW
ncbi:MAG: hypothetical protein WAO83_05225 [Fuerstiella sp.]